MTDSNMIGKHPMRAFLMLVSGVVGIGFSPALVKSLGLSGMGPSAIGFWRNGIGAGSLFLIALLTGQRLKLSRSVFRWALLAGLFFALDLNFWHRSVMYAGSGISTVIGNTQVFITSLLGVWLFGEVLTVRFKLFALTGIIGVVMLAGVLDNGVAVTPLYLKGILFALITALMYALYLISIKKAGTDKTRPSPLVFMAWISLVSSVFMLGGCVFDVERFLPGGGSVIVLILLLGVGVQGVCWWLIASSMVRIETHFVALVLLLQPVMAVIWGFVFFREVLTGYQMTGVAITLISVYLGSVPNGARSRNRPSDS